MPFTVDFMKASNGTLPKEDVPEGKSAKQAHKQKE